MKRYFLFLFLIMFNIYGAQRSVYYNSKNEAAGDGSIGNPYKALASGNTTVTNYIAAGDTVTCFLRDSSVFRGAWAIPSGGINNPLTITNYGNLGLKPVISGAALLTNWTAYASGIGSTWQTALTPVISQLILNLDILLTKGTDQNNLVDKTWFQTGNVLYLRWDEGDPDLTGNIFERVSLTQVLNLSGLSNINIKNIWFRRSSFGIRVTTSASNLHFYNCLFKDVVQWVSLVATTNSSFNNCFFTDAMGPTTPVLISGVSSVKFNVCHMKNCPVSLISISGGKNYINNTNIDNVKNTVVSTTSSDTTFINNSIIHGLYPFTKETLKATNASGPIVVNKSLIMKNGYYNTWYTGPVIFRNVIKDEPKIVKTSRQGIFSITEDDRVTGSEFKILADYAKSVNSNFQLSISMSEANLLTASDSILYRAIADSGHDVVSHSMSHTYKYPDMGAITLSYTGTAPACTAIVRNDSLILKTGGIDDLIYEIEKNKTKNIKWITDLIDPLTNYACAKTSGANDKLSTFVFKTDTLWDVKAAVDSILIDTAKFYPWEFDSSKTYIERVTGKPCLEYTYPGNMTDSTQIPYLKRAGYLGARTTTPNSITMSDNYPLYRIPIHDDPNLPLVVLMLDENTNSTVSSTNFTGVNLTYNNILQADYHGCAFLNGSAYLHRTDAAFTYQEGDFTIGVWIRPTALNAVNTVFFTGVDNNNYLTVYVDNNGAVHYVQQDNGSAVISLTSANGIISLDTWTRLVFRQTWDTISVFTGTTYLANNRIIYSSTNIRPETYNNVTYFGAGWDFSLNQPVAHFTGYFDKIDMGFDIWFSTLSLADQISMQGCFGSSLSHGNFLGPRDLYKTELDALNYYSGRLDLKGLSTGLQKLRSNGTFNADSLYITWIQTDSADYRLRSDSKLKNIGDTSVISGIPNLINFSGDTITDVSGILKVSSINIGAYGTLNLDLGCDSNLTPLDSSQLGATKVILKDSLICDTGKILLQISQDTNSTVTNIDSVLQINFPYEWIDTLDNLNPSNDYYFRTIFIADTGSGRDTTVWLKITMKDTADTSDPWFIPWDITIDSIFRRYSWIDSTLKFYISNMPDSGTIFMKINSIILNPIVKCSEGIFEAKVPIGTPPGLYTKPVLFSVSGIDTTAIDTASAIRILKFQILQAGN